MMLKLQKKFKA